MKVSFFVAALLYFNLCCQNVEARTPEDIVVDSVYLAKNVLNFFLASDGSSFTRTAADNLSVAAMKMRQFLSSAGYVPMSVERALADSEFSHLNFYLYFLRRNFRTFSTLYPRLTELRTFLNQAESLIQSYDALTMTPTTPESGTSDGASLSTFNQRNYTDLYGTILNMITEIKVMGFDFIEPARDDLEKSLVPMNSAFTGVKDLPALPVMPGVKVKNQCPKCIYVGIELRRDLIDWMTTSPRTLQNPKTKGACPSGVRKREQHGKGKCCCMFGSRLDKNT